MGLCCLSSRIHWRKRSKISTYPKHQQLWSSEFLEDHPSAPEVTAELSKHRSANAATTISSPNDFIMMWRDPKNLVAIVRTEWIEGPEETFHRDKWFGRQSLLYYQVEKMVDLLQSPKGIDFSETQRKALDRYPYPDFCQRLGLLDSPLSETIQRLEPRPENQELFEAYVGITQRHLPKQHDTYQSLKQWLSDLESYTHPYPRSSEKEVLSNCMIPSTGRFPERPMVKCVSDSPSGAIHSVLQPTLPISSRTPHQPALSTPCVPALSPSSSPPSTSTSLNPTGLPSPTVPATGYRRKEIQELSTYTSRLIQYGIDSKIDVRYDPVVIEHAFPPLFHCKVHVGDFTAEGSGTTKKEAKHKASEAAFIYVPKAKI